VTSQNPSRDWLAESHGTRHVRSQWLTGHMNNYQEPIHQLVVELDALSRTSRGRALLSRLEIGGIDTRGANSALEVAHDLEWNPRRESSPAPDLDKLVALSIDDSEVSLILLVALRQVLQEMTFSIGRLSSDPDVTSEIVAELLAGIAMADGAKSVEQLLDRTYRTTRRTIRRRERQAARELPWDIDDDVEETLVAPEQFTAEVLGELIHRGYLREADAELFRLTRVDGISLSNIARRRGVRYETLKRRRHRTEMAIRAYLRIAGDA
jgi:DNA-directed RNA polymerase specialized sigma24 family protein